MTPKEFVALTVYYGLARFLPHRLRPGGSVGWRLRQACCRVLLDEVGGEINIEPRVDIGRGRDIRLAHGCSIGPRSWVAAITMGEGATIGPELLCIPTNKPTDLLGRRWIEDDGTFKPPDVGRYAWLGARVTLLPGVKVGEFSVIGAGSVVTSDIPPHAIAAGNPCRVIRIRTPEHERAGGLTPTPGLD